MLAASAMTIPSLTVGGVDEDEQSMADSSGSHVEGYVEHPPPRTMLHGSYAWRPKVTVGTRVLMSDLRVGDNPRCMEYRLGGLAGEAENAAPDVAATDTARSRGCGGALQSIESHRIVCEVVRCPNPRQTVVRSLHVVRVCPNISTRCPPVASLPPSELASRRESNISSTGYEDGSIGSSCLQPALHQVPTVAPEVVLCAPQLNPARTDETNSPAVSANSGGDAPDVQEEGEPDTIVRAPSPNHVVPPVVVVEKVTLQHTVPSHCVLTVLECLLDQCGVLSLVQPMMANRDLSSVVVVLDQLAERLESKHVGELSTDPVVAAVASTRFHSFLLLCGEDPNLILDRSATYTSRLRPELAVLHAFRGRLLCSLRRFDEALSAASAALLFDPTSPETYHVAASALYALDRLEEAAMVVNVASCALPALSPEFCGLATAVRSSRCMKPLLPVHGLSVLPVSLDECLRAVRLQSVAANKACSYVTGRTALSPHAVEECWSMVNAPCTSTTHCLRLFPHKMLRCVAMRSFAPASGMRQLCVKGDPLSSAVDSVGGFRGKGGDRVLVEAVSVLLPLTAILSSKSRQKIKSSHHAVCGYCGWLLTPKQDVLNAARAVHRGLEHRVRDHYPCRVPIACEGSGCSEMYCGEVCRIKAFVAYHELECDGRDSTWRPVPTNELALSVESTPPAATRWNHKALTLAGSALDPGKSQSESSPLLSTYSPRRRASDVVFAMSPDDSIHGSRPHGNGGYGSGDFAPATQSGGHIPGPVMVDECAPPRRWSLAYPQLHVPSLNNAATSSQDSFVPPIYSAATTSLAAGASDGCPPLLNTSARGSGASEMLGGSQHANSPHRQRQGNNKVQAAFSARLQAARRSSTTVRGSADVVASLRSSIKRVYHEISDGALHDAPTHVRTAAAVFVRCTTTLLSLLFPASVAWDGGQRMQRQQRDGFHTREHQGKKNDVIRAAIEACEARGVSHAGDRSAADKRDPYGLTIAEELLRRLGIPFTATEGLNRGSVTSTLPQVPTSPSQVAKRRDSLAPTVPSFPKNSTGGRRSSKPSAPFVTMAAQRADASDALNYLWSFVHSASTVIQLRCRDDAVAVTASCAIPPTGGGPFGAPSGPPSPRGQDSNSSAMVGPASPMLPFHCRRRISAVWTVEDDADATLTNRTGTASVLHLSDKDEPSVWTVGRLLSFLGQPIFTEMLWDMCLTSHTVLPLCAPAAAVGPHLPTHLIQPWASAASSFMVGVAVLGRTLSLITDWQRCDEGMKQPTESAGTRPQQHQVVQSRFGVAPQSRSLLAVGSAMDLKMSRGLLSLSSQPSSSSEGDRDDEDAAALSLGADDALHDGSSSLDHRAAAEEPPSLVGGMMQAMQWNTNIENQLELGGNVAIDPSDPAMCCPGERRIVLKSICSVYPRDTLRLLMQTDIIDLFLIDLLDSGSLRRRSSST